MGPDTAHLYGSSPRSCFCPGKKAIDRAAKSDSELTAALGGDFPITPEIVVVRDTEEDGRINEAGMLIDDGVTTLASLRKKNGRMAQKGELPGSKIGTRWRFDRGQIDDWMKSKRPAADKKSTGETK